MPVSPFPQGTKLPTGDQLGRVVRSAEPLLWIHRTQGRQRVLLMTSEFLNSLPASAKLVDLREFSFGGLNYSYLISDERLDLTEHLARPTTAEEGLVFARALAEVESPFSRAIFDGAGARMFPLPGTTEFARDKANVLGSFLTGGIEVRADDIVALQRILPKMDLEDLESIVRAAGLEPKAPIKSDRDTKPSSKRRTAARQNMDSFQLPGRQALADFFNEHVIEIVSDPDRYSALGISFPGGIILEGPTGCGKTFAVERLVEHLGWPSFNVEASSVASPYIHETSRKIAQVFSEAIKVAPSVIVIDEMDAFLSNRETGSHQHHVEEVAEFLRRIPEAAANRVLVIGMTNQVEAIDPAILRRGRFDHVIHVDHAGQHEVEALLNSLFAGVPNDVGDRSKLASELAGRPLSDVAFVVREAARLTARRKKSSVGMEEVEMALRKSPSRAADDNRRIGF